MELGQVTGATLGREEVLRASIERCRQRRAERLAKQTQENTITKKEESMKKEKKAVGKKDGMRGKCFDLSAWFSENHKMSDEDMVKKLTAMKKKGIKFRSTVELPALVKRYRRIWKKETW